MWRAVVRNEDVVPVFTVKRHDREAAAELATTWLLGFTDEQRLAIDTRDSDEGWVQTLLDNGFFSIALYEE